MRRTCASCLVLLVVLVLVLTRLIRSMLVSAVLLRLMSFILIFALRRNRRPVILLVRRVVPLYICTILSTVRGISLSLVCTKRVVRFLVLQVMVILVFSRWHRLRFLVRVRRLMIPRRNRYRVMFIAVIFLMNRRNSLTLRFRMRTVVS